MFPGVKFGAVKDLDAHGRLNILVKLLLLLLIHETVSCSPRLPTGSNKSPGIAPFPALSFQRGQDPAHSFVSFCLFEGTCCPFLPLGLCQHPQGSPYSLNLGKGLNLGFFPHRISLDFLCIPLRSKSIPLRALIIKSIERCREKKAQWKSSYCFPGRKCSCFIFINVTKEAGPQCPHFEYAQFCFEVTCKLQCS